VLKVKKQLPSSQAEELARLQEDTGKLIERERVPGQDDYENHKRQEGTWLHSNELVRRITGINPGVWVEDSINCPGHANFYYSKDGRKACAQAPFKKGPLREFNIIHNDAAGRPVGIEYGWREVLKRLLQKRLISWLFIQMTFPLYESVRSERFNQQIRKFKN
jgi:hypothetical protein